MVGTSKNHSLEPDFLFNKLSQTVATIILLLYSTEGWSPTHTYVSPPLGQPPYPPTPLPRFESLLGVSGLLPFFFHLFLLDLFSRQLSLISMRLISRLGTRNNCTFAHCCTRLQPPFIFVACFFLSDKFCSVLFYVFFYMLLCKCLRLVGRYSSRVRVLWFFVLTFSFLVSSPSASSVACLTVHSRCCCCCRAFFVYDVLFLFR